MNVIKISLI